MDLFANYPFIITLVLINYLIVIGSLFHLIFKTDYTMGQRLNWMVLLWIVPVLGPLIYWVFWNRRSKG